MELHYESSLSNAYIFVWNQILNPMQLFLFLLIPTGIFYDYWYFIRKAQPILARAQTTQNFDSVVPIMEEQQIELLYENESSEMEQPVLLENDESVLLMWKIHAN